MKLIVFLCLIVLVIVDIVRLRLLLDICFSRLVKLLFLNFSWMLSMVLMVFVRLGFILMIVWLFGVKNDIGVYDVLVFMCRMLDVCMVLGSWL